MNPVVLVLDELPKLYGKDRNLANYIDATFGSLEDCRKFILTDFCRHAFDGSGADVSVLLIFAGSAVCRRGRAYLILLRNRVLHGNAWK